MLPGKRYTTEDVFEVAKRYKWLIVLPWIVVSVGTIIVARALPDRYRAESVIQVVPQRVPENFVKSTVTAKIEERLPAISQQILSRTRLERIIQDFGLYAAERKTELMEDIVKEMRDDIGVQIVKGDAFQVSYVSTDAKTAMKVTERIASLFVEENLRDREMLAEGANQFLDSQLDDARRRLLDHEKKLEEFRREYNGELPSQLQANVNATQNAESQVQALAESINRDRDRQLMLERLLADANAEAAASAAAAAQLAAMSSASADGETPGNGSAAAQLEAARNALQTAQLRLKSTHPDIKNLQRRIQELEKKAEAEAVAAPVSQVTPPKPVSPADAMRKNRTRDIQLEIENLTRQIAYKQATQKKLQATIADLQRRVDRTPTRESELIALNRDYETLEKVYTNLLAKGEDAKVAANLERRQIGEQFKVIDAARLPEKSFSPDRVKIDLIGSLAGLGVGIAIVGLLAYRDTSFRSDDDVVSVLSLPVLAIVPAIVTAAEARARRRRTLWGACSAAVFLMCGAAAFISRGRLMDLLDRWR